jgi:hypothetical protein
MLQPPASEIPILTVHHQLNAPRLRPSRPRVSTDILAASSHLPRIAMVSTHGYVAANPPLGAADTGGQVVYVLELARKLALLGYEIDIWTRQFEKQPQLERVADRVRIIRMPCGGREFVPKEYLCDFLPEWNEHALTFIQAHGLEYRFINSHYWDAGLAAQHLCNVLEVPHVHTPHSIGLWKQRQMETDYPEGATQFEKIYNFGRRIQHATATGSNRPGIRRAGGKSSHGATGLRRPPLLPGERRVAKCDPPAPRL